MANPTSKLNLVVNGVTTSYDIHDANAVPRSGGNVITGTAFNKTANDSSVTFCGGMGWDYGASITLSGKDRAGNAGNTIIRVKDNSNTSDFILNPNGTATWNNKNLAMQEDVIPRSGGAVMAGQSIYKTSNTDRLNIGGGSSWDSGATVTLYGAQFSTNAGNIQLQPASSSATFKTMFLGPTGTWTWSGTACQITSDQRLKQQIDAIDDKLLDAWEDVELCQFKYNDAVDQKGKDKARLHTGYVVQQIQKACEEHGVDISQYGLFCHEEYAEETEEVEVTQKDGTKTKERKVIREANEHYSLRYTEALIVECKYLRRCIARLTARIEELEKGNKEVEK